MNTLSTLVQVIEKQDMRYVHDRSWRFEPKIAEARKAHADLYRYMRRDGKASLARVLFRTEQNIVRSVRNAVTDAIMNGNEGHVGGIAKLLS